MDGDSIHPAVRGLTTICRCNNIKYKTIARAIRDGATTLSMVASQSGATTGHCGGTCTPEVQEMLAELAPPPVAAPARPPASPSSAGKEAWWVRK